MPILLTEWVSLTSTVHGLDEDCSETHRDIDFLSDEEPLSDGGEMCNDIQRGTAFRLEN